MTRTATAKRKSKERQARLVPRENCPTPWKQNHNPRSAIRSALGSSARSGQPIRIYPCPCGAHHLTSKTDKRRDTP